MEDIETTSDFTGSDGTVERMLKRGRRSSTAAIFIHAGAGYHSQVNEKIHLEACSEAARVGMRFLKSGASATEAVEAAVRSLEDKEITNAGYGSNLNMDGVVECDATIVDHLGRSGACGAVPGIKNPISLAKLILDKSSKPLSLRRVPPNILVGLGAQLFAEEHHMAAIPNEYLVSRRAKDRYLRWAADLKKADEKVSVASISCKYPEANASGEFEYDKAATLASSDHRRDHSNAILTGTWNEGQPDSPFGTGSPAPAASPPVVCVTPTSTSSQSGSPRLTPSGNRHLERSPLSFFYPRSSGSPKRPTVQRGRSDDGAGVGPIFAPISHDGLMNIDGALLADVNDRPLSMEHGDDIYIGTTATMDTHNQSIQSQELKSEYMDNDNDDRENTPTDSPQDDGGLDAINDTVGAIAIDTQGNIAAASSSGGIGIKHCGRIGPAALVGIGTAVLPENPNDPDLVSVAAVTSGTGEHMATTMAAGKCAERLFHNTRRGSEGQSIEEWDETAVMEAFISDDFMGHPGVKNQCSAGAIGVMAVKKARNGIYFYFAHNTDSFALASMSAKDTQPLCVMSRLGDRREITQGARKISVD